MRYAVAQPSTAIHVVTSVYFALTIAMAVAMFFMPAMGFVVVALALVGAFCYLTTPVAYEVNNGRLRVVTHLWSTDFGNIRMCEKLEGTISPFTIRVFGNGGVFGGTGFYWSQRDGLYQAYLTTARWKDMLMLDTARRRLLISPEEPDAFVEACASSPEAEPIAS